MTATGPGQNVAQATIAELLRRYADGDTIESLALRYSLSYRKARTLLLDAGVTLRPPKIQLPPTPPGLVNVYHDGRSIRQLADKHRMTYSQTRRVLLAAGVRLRSRGAPPALPAAKPRDVYPN